MSFILDALKKIEQEKRRGKDSDGAESFALARESRNRRRQALSMGAIALASAGVTAVALSTFFGGPEVDQSEPAAETAPAMSLSEIVASEATEKRTEETTLFSSDVGSSSPATDRDEPSPEPISPPSPESLPAPAPAVAPDEPDEPDENVEVAPVESREEPSSIRLVGRERAARGIAFEEPEPDSAADETLPEDFPKLVLQGTSMIDGKAVAVISDQRVFEGDRVQDALVVRIAEREVELEFDGRRFVIRL